MTFTFERDPIAASPVSFLITTRNAAATLPALLAEAQAVLTSLKRPHQIIVSDDGSTDDTAAIAEKWKEQHGHLTLIRQEQASGEGVATKAGIAAAEHPLLFILPADSGVSPKVLPQFLEQIDVVDLVAGARTNLSRWQRFRQGGSGWWLFGTRLSDAACPVRLYRRSLFTWPLQAKSSFVHVEVAAKANFTGCLMAEVALEGAAREGGSWSDLRRVFNRPAFSVAAAVTSGSLPS